MNKQDFQRNFQWSYFGLVIAPKLIKALYANSINTVNGYDVSPGLILPASGPQINSAETSMVVRVILKLKDSDDLTVKRLTLPWSVDCDEDSEYIMAGVPSVGMLQGRYSAMYASRIPARDTPRGYSPKYSRVATVNANLVRSEDLINFTDDDLVWAVYNKKHYSWSDALQKIDDGELLGAAVDKFLALGIAPGRHLTQIYYKASGPVGYVQDGTPYVFPDTSTYSIREYIRKIAGIMPEVNQP